LSWLLSIFRRDLVKHKGRTIFEEKNCATLSRSSDAVHKLANRERQKKKNLVPFALQKSFSNEVKRKNAHIGAKTPS